MQQRITRDDRILGFMLGLGDIVQAPICHNYPNGCSCEECTERERLIQEAVARPTPRQPWDVRPARKAA